MIYFLINNSYHLDLDLKLAKELAGEELALIQVPYSLTPVISNKAFSKIYHFKESIFVSPLRPFDIFKAQREVDKVLDITQEDILLVHTDMDLLNQYIAQKFVKAKAKVFLLEDGTATMCTYNIPPKKPPFKYRLKTFLLNNVYNMPYTNIGVYGAETLYSMQDNLFKGVIVNHGNQMLRKIPLYKLKQIKEPFDILYTNGAIFFNQGLYLWYSTEAQYVEFLRSMLVVSKSFSPFYLKFHPSDTESIKSAITTLVTKYFPDIIILTENEIAEKIIEKYPVKYTITFNSTAALNLINKGITPIFLNHLYGEAFFDPIFGAFDNFLESIGCYVPQSLSEVKPGFKAFAETAIADDSDTLKNILNR